MDPERPIEKLLRDFARERGEEFGAPAKLHPATRRLLKAEAAKQFSRAKRNVAPGLGFFARFWPRMAWGLGGCAVLTLVLLVFSPGRRPHEKPVGSLAKNQALPRAELRMEAPAPATLSTSRSAVETAPGQKTQSLANENRAADSLAAPVEPKATRAADAAKAPEMQLASSTQVRARDSTATNGGPGQDEIARREVNPPPASTVITATTAQTPNELPLRRYGLAGRQSEPSPALGIPPIAAAPVAVPVLTAAERLEPLAQPTWRADGYATQRFKQVSDQAGRNELVKKVGLDNAVLNSFQVMQAGTEVRIVDDDGSIYSGAIQGAEPSPESPAKDKLDVGRAMKLAVPVQNNRATLPTDSASQTWQNYSFQVAGTNRTLNQRVVFTGNFNGFTNQLPPVQNATAVRGLGANTGAVQVKTAPAFLNTGPLQNSRISGKLRIGENRELEFNAVPAKP
jgi:hypothetical protein